MTIHREAKKIVIECDSCNEVFEGEVDEDWDTVWALAKRDGWSARKIAGEWLHGCELCGV